MAEQSIIEQLARIREQLAALQRDAQDGSGGMIPVTGKGADINARLAQIQQELMALHPADAGEERSLLNTLVNTLPSGVLMASRSGEIMLANPAATQMLSGQIHGNMFRLEGRYTYQRADGSPMPLNDIPLTRSIRSGEIVRAEEMTMLAPDGSQTVFLIDSSPYRDAEGRIAGAVAVFQDITHYRAQERERQRLQAAHLRDRELLEGVFETIPGALVVLAGDQLEVQLANPAFRALSPRPAIDPVGLPIDQVWGAAEGFVDRAIIEQVLETGQSVRMDRVSSMLQNELERFLSVHIRKLDWADSPGVLISIWDMTNLEQAHRQSRRAASQAQRRADELDAVINAIPEAVLIYDLQGNIIRANPLVQVTLGFDPQNLSLIDAGKALDLHTIQGDPLEMPAVHALRGEAVNNLAVCFQNRSSGEETAALVSSSPMFSGGQVVGAVSVWRDVSEMNRRNRELETLVRMAAALRDAGSQSEMIAVVLEQVISLLRVDGAMLVQLDEVSSENVVVLARGRWERFTGQRMPPGAGITSNVISSGEAYVNSKILSDPRLVNYFFFDDITAGACVPLKTQQRPFGALWIGKSSAISADEVRLLTGIADMAANAMHRARLFEQTRLRLEHLTALHGIDMAITSSMDLNFTLSVVLEHVTTQLGVDAADILLLEPALNVLEYAASRGFSSEPKSLEFHLGEGFAGQAALERQPVIIPDINQHPYPNGRRLWREGERFVAYFAIPLVAKGAVKGVLECFQRQPFYPDAEWLDFFKTLGTQTAIAVDSAELFNRLQHSNDELSIAYDATIQGWSRALELRDYETHGHSERVTQMAVQLARWLGMRDEDIRYYRYGVLLHDIGKMAIPDDVLLKPGPLTDEEWEIMRRHPMYAYELLMPIPYLRQSLNIPYCHHEWWDGSGYPRGLSGEEIPISARIFAVVDVWDALRSDRPYRGAWDAERVAQYIRDHAGTQFDPRVVEGFMRLLAEMGLIEPQGY